MATYRRKPGQRHGHNWYIPNIRKTGEFRHVVIDTNPGAPGEVVHPRQPWNLSADLSGDLSGEAS